MVNEVTRRGAPTSGWAWCATEKTVPGRRSTTLAPKARPLPHPLAEEGALGQIVAEGLLVAAHVLIVGDGRVASAAALDQEGARLVVVLFVAILGRARRRGRAEEGERRAAKIVVPDGVRARADLVGEAHAGDELPLGRLVRMVDVGDGRPGPQRALVQRVAEHHGRALAVRVVEGVGDARLFQQPREEGVIALVVLHLVLELGVAPPVDLPGVLHGERVEQRVHDVGDGEVLEDAVIDPLGEEPKPRHDAELVGRLAHVRRLALGLLDEAHDPAEDAGTLEEHVDVAGVDLEHGRLAHQRLEIEARIRRAGHDGHREQRRHALRGRELTDLEREDSPEANDRFQERHGRGPFR